MSAILSLPQELLVLIFVSCGGISEALKLSSTCKYIYLTWLQHRTEVIPELASSSIPYFDDALVAVRAVTIMRRSKRDSTILPFPTIQALRSGIQRASLTEVEAIFHLEHMIPLIEPMIFISARGHDASEMSSADHVDRRQKTYRRIYRILKAGPIISEQYLESVGGSALEHRHVNFTDIGDEYFNDMEGLDSFNVLGGDMSKEQNPLFQRFAELVLGCLKPVSNQSDI